MTRKELASELYDLFEKAGITDRKLGVGKKEWVRRVLKGYGSSKPWSKDELLYAVEFKKKEEAIQ